MTWLTEGLLLGAVPVILLWIIRRNSAPIKANKWLTRLIVVAVCGIMTVVHEYGPDSAMTAEEFTAAFGAMLAAAQLEYSWILKTLKKDT